MLHSWYMVYHAAYRLLVDDTIPHQKGFIIMIYFILAIRCIVCANLIPWLSYPRYLCMLYTISHFPIE